MKHLLTALAILIVAPFGQAQELDVSIDDFAFLTGYWSGSGMGGKSEEMWMPPADGRMFGIFKQSDSNGLIFTELMEISKVEDNFVLRLKHFNPDFSGWEEKTEHVTFSYSGKSENAAQFGSLRYRVEGSNTLLIELDMRQNSGAVTTETFVLNKKEI